MPAPIVTTYTVSTGTPIQNVPPDRATQGETMVPYVPLFQTGLATLIAGLATVGSGAPPADGAGVTLTPQSRIWFSIATPGGGGNGVAYQVTARLNGPLNLDGTPTAHFTVTAIDTAGATVATDVSTVQWFVMG